MKLTILTILFVVCSIALSALSQYWVVVDNAANTTGTMKAYDQNQNFLQKAQFVKNTSYTGPGSQYYCWLPSPTGPGSNGSIKVTAEAPSVPEGASYDGPKGKCESYFFAGYTPFNLPTIHLSGGINGTPIPK